MPRDNKKTSLKTISILIIFTVILLALISGCKEEQSACGQPFVKKVFFYDGLAYCTYVLLCGADVVGTGVEVIDPETEKTLSKNDILNGWAEGIFVKEDLVYVANGSYGLAIIDAQDKSGLRAIAIIDTAGYANSVFVYKDYAYVADGGQGLAIIDVADPYRPKLRFSIASDGYVSDVWVEGDYIYIASGDSGLEIIPMSDILKDLE